MGTDTPIRWQDRLLAVVAMITMALLAGSGASQAQTKPGGNPNVVVPAAGNLGFVPALQRGVMDYIAFVPALQRGVVPADGWPLFLHGDIKLKFGAPVPAVPLLGAEWKQWRSDLVTFKFRKLKDRQLLYIHYLSPPKSSAKTDMADAVLRAVKKEARLSKGTALWTAIGVEYEIKVTEFQGAKGTKLLIEPEFLRWAAVPVKWSQASYQFIMNKHDPETFAALVKATATALPTGTYANFGAVEGWSALAKMKGLTVKDSVTTSGMGAVAAVYLKALSKGPFTWLDLKPVASFIALDRKLDVAGVKPKAVLTSKAAWLATGK